MRTTAPALLPYGDAFYAYQKCGSLSSADVVVPAVCNMVRPTSVVDVGCGLGTWLAAVMRAGVDDVLGLDGIHVSLDDLMIPPDRFRPADLSQPFHLPRAFDLAISVEVAEHLPPTSADAFVRSLTDLAPAILFSAAVPHQGGWHHLNEQWPQYWAEIFATRNFFPSDCLRERFWDHPSVRWWYAQNMIMYLAADHWLWKTCRRSAYPLRALVHPENYLLRIAEAREATRPRTAKETLVRIVADIVRLPVRTLNGVRKWRPSAEPSQ
jgi:SAM-dependent methyltransferase